MSDPKGIREAVALARYQYEALSPVDKAIHDAAQKRSFIRAQTGLDPGPDVLAEEVQRLRVLLASQPKEGWVLVPQTALDWLNGLGDDFEPQPGQRGAFWWRSEFRRRCQAEVPTPKGEEP